MSIVPALMVLGLLGNRRREPIPPPSSKKMEGYDSKPTRVPTSVQIQPTSISVQGTFTTLK